MQKPAEISVQYLKGVGPSRAVILERLGVLTVEDLLYLFPRRYEDRRRLTPLKDVRAGEGYTVCGRVTAAGGRRSFAAGKRICEIVISDETGDLTCVWFNQSFLERYFRIGVSVVLSGRVDYFKNRLQMSGPEYELIESGEQETLNMGRIVPVYPLTRGVTQRYLRKLVYAALQQYADQLDEVIPAGVRKRLGLISVAGGIRGIHFPEDDEARQKADRRISFEEFFLFQISVMLRRREFLGGRGCSHYVPEELLARFVRTFPFELTSGQLQSIRQISADMQRPSPMLRLLQGDVGSGKTVVSFFGCMTAVVNGFQAAIMAPTEILAEQHYKSFVRYFSDGPFGAVRVELMRSSLNRKERESLLIRIREGEVDVVIGTHALIGPDVAFKALSFVCIDEQHKFGVRQRALLSAKGEPPDVLVMTATPIPRTLCLTLYGDLDVSVISTKPQGRGEIRTYHFPEIQVEGVYRKVVEWVKGGTQAFIVYPVIEESEKDDLKAAQVMFEKFKSGVFRELRVGLVHGRMKREDAGRVMECFKRHEIDVLVTTTVLEVGIDVPNANVMVIEHAARFGLSQLHQLRGRIGRGEKNAVCILLGDVKTVEADRRIQAMLQHNDGFRLAEEDLKIRGPGQYFGRHQHGLNELKVTDPLSQIQVLEEAREQAEALVAADPVLGTVPLIRETICRRYPEYLKTLQAG